MEQQVRKGLFMITKHRSFNLSLSLLIGGFVFAGCYTRIETFSDGGNDGGNNDEYAENDSSSTRSDTTGKNYFSNDDYRSLQYRGTFDYYSPSWYDWGDGVEPWYGGYDYPWDATLMYPYPYWDGGYDDYGWGFGVGYGYGYGRYRNRGLRGYSGSLLGSRRRTVGTTRGALDARGTLSSGNGIGSFRPSAASGTATLNTSRFRSAQEVPWWQRAKMTAASSQSRAGAAQRPRTSVRNTFTRYGSRNGRAPASYRMSAQWMNHWIRSQSASISGFGAGSRSSFRQSSPRSFFPQGSSARSGGGRSAGGGGGGRGRGR